MTLDEAFTELGVDPYAGSDGARRAYLRLLKTRKPETDPEGFMRLRAAYELVKANAPFMDALRPRETSVVVAESQVVPVESQVVPVESHVVVADTSVVFADTSVVLADAQVVLPEAQVGMPEGWVVLPEAAVEPEIDHGDIDAMEALLARSDYQQAATQALLILAGATHRLDQRDPPVLSLLRLMLGLHRIAEPEKAREVSKAFKQWLAATGKESTQIRGHAAVLWTLVRELNAMKKGLPDRVRTAIALAVLAGDLNEATSDLVSFRRSQPAVAGAAAGLLRRKAPVIAAALAETLDPPVPIVAPRAPPRPPPPPERAEGMRKWIWFSPLVFGLVRILAALGQSTPSYPDPLSGYHAAAPSYPMMSFDAGDLQESLNELERVQLISRARQIAAAAPSSGRINLRARDAVAMLDMKSCEGALAATADMRAEAAKIKKTILPVLDADIVLFDSSLHRYCEKRGQIAAEAALNGMAPGDAGERGAGTTDAGQPGKNLK